MCTLEAAASTSGSSAGRGSEAEQVERRWRGRESAISQYGEVVCTVNCVAKLTPDPVLSLLFERASRHPSEMVVEAVAGVSENVESRGALEQMPYY